MSNIYAPEYGHTPSATQRLTRAYAAAGVTPPAFTTEVDELLAAEPTVSDLAAQLGREALTAPDPQAWLEEAVARVERAQVIDAIRQGVRSQRGAALAALLPDLLTSASADLAPAFNKAAQALTKAAEVLPADNPLDPEAAIVGDHGKHLRTAREALATLAALGSAWGVGDDSRRQLRGNALRLLVVVDVPEVDPAMIHPKDRSVVNPDPTRDAVRRLLADADDDLDRTLIGVARGDYGDEIRLTLPDQPHAVRDRYRRAAKADTTTAATADELVQIGRHRIPVG